MMMTPRDAGLRSVLRPCAQPATLGWTLSRSVHDTTVDVLRSGLRRLDTAAVAPTSSSVQ